MVTPRPLREKKGVGWVVGLQENRRVSEQTGLTHKCQCQPQRQDVFMRAFSPPPRWKQQLDHSRANLSQDSLCFSDKQLFKKEVVFMGRVPQKKLAQLSSTGYSAAPLLSGMLCLEEGLLLLLMAHTWSSGLVQGRRVRWGGGGRLRGREVVGRHRQMHANLAVEVSVFEVVVVRTEIVSPLPETRLEAETGCHGSHSVILCQRFSVGSTGSGSLCALPSVCPPFCQPGWILDKNSQQLMMSRTDKGDCLAGIIKSLISGRFRGSDVPIVHVDVCETRRDANQDHRVMEDSLSEDSFGGGVICPARPRRDLHSHVSHRKQQQQEKEEEAWRSQSVLCSYSNRLAIPCLEE
ncbi:unnamed protein product [Pleuronectes platessa]|uniref:Uncharacterized protein n=1 Tax=Pleuronectes platessa TaxID=8262 RepID=A0A9N7W0T4_PLEPL|nr:unnamed protein product [Pleuronectes platessa]